MFRISQHMGYPSQHYYIVNVENIALFLILLVLSLVKSKMLCRLFEMKMEVDGGLAIQYNE